MRVRFLLGPAGSGKSHRCLAEIRSELLRDPDGPPLLFLAPKQATYQLERQLLEDASLPGWTRLQILSFDRLARQILQDHHPVSILSEEGRLMVLRALVRRLGPQLRVYHASSRLTGFAQELSGTLRELRNHQLAPDRILDLSRTLASRSLPHLGHKLHDLALLLRAYQHWLADHHVEDADSLPDLATHALRSASAPFHLGGLWLDGFAEMTPQELDLLAAVLEHTRHATLAFCLDHQPAEDASWLSTWSVVTQTFRRCFSRIAATSATPPEIELLSSTPTHHPTRFSHSPALTHLATSWTKPAPASPDAATDAPHRLRLVACRDLESEVITAARSILRHIRSGGRYRDVAVLARSLEPVQPTIERVFLRYGIPFFLDRRESLAHHPLAELSRSALRLVAFNWQRDDWFAALKSDLAGLSPDTVDTLENDALAHGWDATFWRSATEGSTPNPSPLPKPVTDSLKPFLALVEALPASPDATELVSGLRTLWQSLAVRETLQNWQETRPTQGPALPPHLSAWEQLQSWLDNLERGFGSERLPITDWLPILEAGLSSLTAGVIPSAQDQVLVGAIDRSRQPDLRIAHLLAVNEGIFPAPPASGGMLTDDDRARLLDSGIHLGPDRRRRVGHERYFGYIACTRPRELLIVSWSARDTDGNPLNPSSFVRDLQALFPNLPIAQDEEETIHPDAEPGLLRSRLTHASELLPWLLAHAEATPFDGLAGDDLRRAWLRQHRARATTTHLQPDIARALHGASPEVSVSALESMGACPFQFFVRHGLRGTERERFESDGRTVGSLAHELLAQFHKSIRAENRNWRDLEPSEARAVFDQVSQGVVARFQDGVCVATPAARWQTDALLDSLRHLVGVLVHWARRNAFHPAEAELSFGSGQPLPPWRVAIDTDRVIRIRGKIDRLDLHRSPDGTDRFLILDYKLSLPPLVDSLITSGIDLQLAAYAQAIASQPGWLPPPAAPRLLPNGIFYIGLRTGPPGTASRTRHPEATPDEEKDAVHIHRGRFAESSLDLLDTNARTDPSGQFAIRLNKDGSLRKGGDGRPDAEFHALLAGAEAAIQTLARDILDGRVAVSPFARGRQSACERCHLLPVCRFDPATQGYRQPGGPDRTQAGAGLRDRAANPMVEQIS